MAILGVLLGITMCGVIALGIFAYLSVAATGALVLRLEKAEERITVLEKRKAFIPEGQPVSKTTEPVKGAPYRPRTWNEDTAQAEVK